MDLPFNVESEPRETLAEAVNGWVKHEFSKCGPPAWSLRASNASVIIAHFSLYVEECEGKVLLNKESPE